MRWYLLFISCFCLLNAFSQESKRDIYDLNFDELSKIKVSTVSKTEQNAEEIPTTVRVITAEEISERGYFTFDEMLSDLPGFQFRNIQSLNSYVFQRGIPNQNNLILVLIDGIQINELNSGGFYGGGQYDLASIEKVEVVYGPSSVTYGTNAISGIINIITKNATHNGGGISTLAGGFKTYHSSGNYSYVNKEKMFNLRVSGMIKSSDKADLKGANGDYNWTDLLDNQENDYSFGIKATYKNITFGTNYQDKQSSVGAFQKSVGTVYKDYGTCWNIQFVNNYMQYRKQLSDKMNWSSVVYNRNATVLRNTVYLVTDTAQIGYYRPNNLTGFENVLNYTFNPKIALTSGLVFEYEKLAESASLSYSQSIDIAPPLPADPSFQKNFLTSVFAEPRLNLVKGLFVSGGLRFDYSTVYDKVVTPRAGLTYNLGKLSTLISYAQAFRAPKPWDYYDGIGNPDLLPEKMKSIEWGLNYQITPNFISNINVYRNRLQNGIIKENTGNVYYWGNGGEMNTNGLEGRLSYVNKKFKAYLNYTFTKSVNEEGIEVPEISLNTANLGCTWMLYPKLKLNIRTNYVGGRKNPKLITTTQSFHVDPYLIFNGALTWNPVEVITVQLIGKNLLNSEYYHTSNRSPDRYRQAQQTVLLSIAYQIQY